MSNQRYKILYPQNNDYAFMVSRSLIAAVSLMTILNRGKT
jgi:hypothetical protein